MARVGQFVSTRIQSEILSWAQETTQETFSKRIVNLQTLFQSTTHATTNVTLKEVYEVEQQRQQNADGTWKARVILLAPAARLLADAKQAEADLQRELTVAQQDAERTVRLLKAQLRELHRGEEISPLPAKLSRFEEILPRYTQLQNTHAAIKRARQAIAARNGVEALRAYKDIPVLTGDAPEDDTPIPDLSHVYQQTWEAVKAAIALLESAQKNVKSRDIERAEKELDAYHERIGNATGPFTHAITGETLHLPILPDVLREQLKAAGQVITISLTFTHTGLTDAQADQFRKRFADQLRQKGYSVTTQADGNSVEVRGVLELKTAPVGPLVSMNLSVTLSWWRRGRAFAEGRRFNSGVQLGKSEGEAFDAAERGLLRKCVAEIVRQVKGGL
jgi:hypothetical protein